jgi:hypothetical protein
MSVKLIALIFIFGMVAHEAQSQWLGWPYYGYGWPGHLGYYGKRSAGFDANPAVTGSTAQPQPNAYPSGMSFASTTQEPQKHQMDSSTSGSTAQPAQKL